MNWLLKQAGPLVINSIYESSIDKHKFELKFFNDESYKKTIKIVLYAFNHIDFMKAKIHLLTIDKNLKKQNVMTIKDLTPEQLTHINKLCKKYTKKSKRLM